MNFYSLFPFSASQKAQISSRRYRQKYVLKYPITERLLSMHHGEQMITLQRSLLAATGTKLRSTLRSRTKNHTDLSEERRKKHRLHNTYIYFSNLQRHMLRLVM